MIDYFGITVSAAGWIATAYILANAVFVPIWGKLGDTIGRKKVYVIGFVVFIPFLIIDMVVASVLMSMGMMMLSPVIISLPFKIMLFVLVDGWNLLIGSLVQSFFV